MPPPLIIWHTSVTDMAQKAHTKAKKYKKKTLQEFCNNRDTSEHDKNLWHSEIFRKIPILEKI